MIERQQTPWTQGELQAIAENLLGKSRADATEVVLHGRTNHLTRFANSQIHQNVSEQDLVVSLRLAFGQKVGLGSTNDLSPEGLARAVADAELMARLQPDNPEFPGFAQPLPAPVVNATSERTLAATPADRAAVARHVCERAIAADLSASGAYTTGLQQVAVANSNGLWAYHQNTIADFNTVVMSPDSSGWAAHAGLDAAEIDGAALAEEAIAKALRSRHPQDLEPGHYTVILEEYAVNDLIQYLVAGCGAEEVREGLSFMSDRMGETVAHAGVSIWDDGHDAAGLPMPFDYEGTPKQRVPLITEGRIEGPVYDRRNAAIEGRRSTGHFANSATFYKGGAKPWNVFMAPGQHTKAEMLASTERGIWVTRFHYVNRLDARKTTVTGMTRDGTFWIENGKIAHPLRNLRFTHAILDALRDVVMIGRDTKLEQNWFGGGTRVPALKIENFRFSGKTLF